MTMFVHQLTIVRTPLDAGLEDEYGQPGQGAPVETIVSGLVQPRRHDEMDDPRSAGSELADHVIFVPGEADVRPSDAIEYDGERYEIRGVRRFRFGGLAHYEIDARRVTGAPVTAAGS